MASAFRNGDRTHVNYLKEFLYFPYLSHIYLLVFFYMQTFFIKSHGIHSTLYSALPTSKCYVFSKPLLIV